MFLEGKAATGRNDPKNEKYEGNKQPPRAKGWATIRRGQRDHDADTASIDADEVTAHGIRHIIGAPLVPLGVQVSSWDIRSVLTAAFG